MWKTRVPRVVVVAALFVLAACGGTAGTPSPQTSIAAATSSPKSMVAELASESVRSDAAPTGATTVKMDLLSFTPSALTVAQGTVVLFLNNPDVDRNHLMSISDAAGNLVASSTTVKSETKVIFTIHGLKPGTYPFKCTIAGMSGRIHASEGMTGTLTVT
jgi:plastocyanin